MEKQNLEAPTDTQDTVITFEQMLKHWQGHRSLTRRVIDAFPEKELFSYSVGGMRPFADLALEMIGMAVPGMKGIVTGTWEKYAEASGPKTKAALLEQWDAATKSIDEYWTRIPAGRFQEIDLAFGQWEGPIHWIFSYFVDNEIHHRGQGYVYLRSLGITPPPFWER